jgi:MFS family permease
MSTQEVVLPLPWYRSLGREQWRVLLASNLAWLSDGFEIYALFLTVGFALHQLLDVAQYSTIPEYAGYVLATTVFGWATGSVIGGIIADYIGRKRNDDAGDPRLFADHRIERVGLGLAILSNLALSRRRRDRLGMGHRRLDCLGIVARPCAR